MDVGFGARGRGALVVMRVVSTLELVTLILILTNRFTLHVPAITSTGGPIHGLLYVSSIVLALLLPFPRSAKWLAVVPGIGGLLALWRARRVAAGAAATAPALTDGPVLTEEDRARAAVIVDEVSVTLSRTTRVGPLSFTVPRNGVTGLIGPNGAGKTTALRMLCGLIAPTGGSVTVVAGDAVREAEGFTAPPMGVLIDSPSFLPGLSARKNLLALTRLAGWPAILVDEALERVGLSAAAERRVGTFSLGMKQRLGLAVALLGRPRVVILDEPTNGLDPRGTVELRAFLRSLVDEGITVIIASHALDEIEELCDHLVAMQQGRVFFTGAPARMLEAVPASVQCRTTTAADLPRAVAAFEAHGLTVEITDDRTATIAGDADLGAVLNGLAHVAGVTLAEISPRRPTLQDAFLRSTGQPTDADARPRRLEMTEVSA